MAIPFQGGSSAINAPALGGFAVTTSNTVDLAIVTRGVYVGVSGDLKVITYNGETVTFAGLAAGIIHPISATRIFATGTTATGIIGVY